MGAYSVYILAAYGVSALALGGLVLFTALDARRQRRRLAFLERGAGRPPR